MAYPAAPSYPATPGGDGAATAPGLTVSDRLDGAAYTVTAGARSLTITNPDTATLLTTVRKASDGSAITVTNSADTNPSWTVASGGQDGESYQVRVRATKGGLTTSVAFTERVTSTGLQNIALTEIDLSDGTWTLSDPDGLVNTVAFASGQNTVTFNAVAGSNNYNISSGTTFRGPRWYKLLSISGQQATTAMPTVLVTRLEPDPGSGSDFGQRHIIGTTFNPTSTVTNDINGVGAGWQINESSTSVAMGVWTRGAVSLTSSALNERSVMASLRGFESLGSPGYLNLKSDDTTLATGARNSGQLAIGGSGANLYIMVGLGTTGLSASITAGDQAVFKAAFIASSYTGI